VRPVLVVVHPPVLEEDLRLQQGVEGLSVQELVAESAIEALDPGVLPRLSGQSKIGPPVGPDNRYYILPIDAISLLVRRIAIGRIIGASPGR
jgi:hypothetical protein